MQSNRDLDKFARDRQPSTIHYDEADSIFMHYFFAHHADRVGKELLSPAKIMQDSDGNGFIKGKLMWDRLCATLVEVGQVIDRPTQASDPTSTNQLLAAHLKRYRHYDVSNVDHLFFPLPTLHVSLS